MSDFGHIAVADPAASAVFYFHNNNGERRPAPIDHNFSEPARVAFDRDDMLVLDRLGLSRGRVGGFWSTIFAGKFAPVQDIGAYRGIYYVADEDRLATFAEGGTPARISTPGAVRSRFARLAVRGPLLVAADFQQRVVTRLDRPVPVTFRWNPVRTTKSSAEVRDFATRALTASYDYLASGGLLQFAPVQAERASRMDEWLVSQRVLLWPLAGPADRPGAAPATFAPLQPILCQRNKEICAGGGELLGRQLKGGEQVWVPSLSLSTSISTSAVELQGRRVEDHLKERVSSAEQRLQITDANLAELNRGDFESLEIEMTRRGFVLATPASPALRPGALVRVEGGRDIVVGTVQAGCNLDLSLRRDRAPLPRLVRTSSPNEYLPLREKAERKPTFRASAAEMEFPDLAVERIDPPAYEKLRALAGHACLQQGRAEYLVTQALSATVARYRLLLDGNPIFLSPENLKAWDLVGLPNQQQKWSMEVYEPQVVAFRVVPIDAIATAYEETPPLEVSRVKPLSPQNLRNRSTGTLVLPVSAWQFDTLVPSYDIEPNSRLRSVERQHPGLSVPSPYSEPPRMAADVQSCGSEGPLTDATVKQRMTSAHDALLKTIHYSEELGKATTERVAIGERTSTVDVDHPDFATADGQSVWLQPDSLLGLQTRTARQSKPLPPKLRPFDLNQDHGTHVAGILAAQSNVMPGLVPDSTLFLIDASAEGTLSSGIQTAVNSGIQIFSFSWDWPHGPLSTIKASLADLWKDQLFVVSAGNSGKHLSKVGAMPLVAWVGEHDNILGVGAATADGTDVLGSWDENGETRDGSSFGSQYVHLIAPATSVVSLARDNGYTCATGSSTATPQVAAAAAMLRSKGIATALQIKARLIYTADWLPAFEGKVLGGKLNIERAAFEHNRNVYQTHSGKERRMSIVLRNDALISVANSLMQEPNGRIVAGPAQIRSRDILRLHWLNGSSYRAIVLKDAVLRTVTGDLSGRLSCHTLEEWNSKTGLFDPTTQPLKDQCRAGIDVTTLRTYVARVPGQVRFF